MEWCDSPRRNSPRSSEMNIFGKKKKKSFLRPTNFKLLSIEPNKGKYKLLFF